MRDVLASLLQVALEAAQVEHVVDDLEGEPERLEVAPEAFDLLLAVPPPATRPCAQSAAAGAAVFSRWMASTRCSRTSTSPRSSAAGTKALQAVEVDRLTGVTCAQRLEVEIVELQLRRVGHQRAASAAAHR